MVRGASLLRGASLMAIGASLLPSIGVLARGGVGGVGEVVGLS